MGLSVIGKRPEACELGRKMMQCHKVRRLFSCYLDHELSQKDNSWLESHLAVCPECSSEMRQLQDAVCLVRDTFNQMEEVRLGADFIEKFYRNISMVSRF